MNLYYKKTLLFGMILTLLMTKKVNGQNNDVVKDQGITSEIHKANIGKILFTNNAIAIQDQRPSDFLSSYKLTNKSNLFMTVFLAHSNTNYLHRLALGISADSLVKIGNYQFSFFIDGKLIYETNLYTGAPRAPSQDTETAWSKPLIDNQHEGALWSQSAWNRFTHYGGDSVLTDGPHTLKIELRDYIKIPELKIGSLIASGELNLQVERVPVINLSGLKLVVGCPNDDAAFAEKWDRVVDVMAGRVVIFKGKVDEHHGKKNQDGCNDPVDLFTDDFFSEPFDCRILFFATLKQVVRDKKMNVGDDQVAEAGQAKQVREMVGVFRVDCLGF